MATIARLVFAAFDCKGRMVVATTANEGLHSGKNILSLPVESVLSNGTYVIQMTRFDKNGDRQICTKRMSLVP